MANFKRGYPRSQQTGHGVKAMHSWPRWWDIVFHRRPPRRTSKRMEHLIQLDKIDADDASFPTGTHKPHNYFW